MAPKNEFIKFIAITYMGKYKMHLIDVTEIKGEIDQIHVMKNTWYCKNGSSRQSDLCSNRIQLKNSVSFSRNQIGWS